MSKKGKTKVPKRIAGVKIPKKVRKSRFGKLLASPQGQALVAEALSAAAALAGGATMVKQSGKDSAIGHVADTIGRKLKGAAADAQVTGAGAAASADVTAHRFAHALGEAARSFNAALHDDAPVAAETTTVGELRPRRRPASSQPAY